MNGYLKKNSKSKTNDMLLEPGFRLRNYFSNRMSAAEFQGALVNMLAIRDFYHSKMNYGRGYKHLPWCERLGSTPLDDSIVVSQTLIKEFQTKNGLDIVNTIFLTDGDSTSNIVYKTSDGKAEYPRGNIFLRDFQGRTYKVESRWTRTELLLKILKKNCGVNNIGFFITSSKKKNIMRDFSNKFFGRGLYHLSEKQSEDLQKKYSKFKSDGFIVDTSNGYDEFYIIPGGKDLSTDSEEELSSDFSKRKLAGVFKRNAKNQVFNRVLLSRFIDKIS